MSRPAVYPPSLAPFSRRPGEASYGVASCDEPRASDKRYGECQNRRRPGSRTPAPVDEIAHGCNGSAEPAGLLTFPTSATGRSSVEEASDDPPERIAAWLDTVSTSALGALDVKLLLDLLRIDHDPAHWGTLMTPVVRLLDDLLLVGDFEAASQLVSVLASEASNDTSGAPAPRAGCHRHPDRPRDGATYHGAPRHDRRSPVRGRQSDVPIARRSHRAAARRSAVDRGTPGRASAAHRDTPRFRHGRPPHDRSPQELAASRHPPDGTAAAERGAPRIVRDHDDAGAATRGRGPAPTGGGGPRRAALLAESPDHRAQPRGRGRRPSRRSTRVQPSIVIGLAGDEAIVDDMPLRNPEAWGPVIRRLQQNGVRTRHDFAGRDDSNSSNRSSTHWRAIAGRTRSTCPSASNSRFAARPRSSLLAALPDAAPHPARTRLERTASAGAAVRHGDDHAHLSGRRVGRRHASGTARAPKARPTPRMARTMIDGLAQVVAEHRTATARPHRAQELRQLHVHAHGQRVDSHDGPGARRCGIDGPLLREFGLAALMHDIGKVTHAARDPQQDRTS